METYLLAFTTFLGGLVVAGAAGVLRGDWLGERAARDVEIRLGSRLVEIITELRELRREMTQAARDAAANLIARETD